MCSWALGREWIIELHARSERASKWAHRSARAVQSNRMNEQPEQMSEWSMEERIAQYSIHFIHMLSTQCAAPLSQHMIRTRWKMPETKLFISLPWIFCSFYPSSAPMSLDMSLEFRLRVSAMWSRSRWLIQLTYVLLHPWIFSGWPCSTANKGVSQPCVAWKPVKGG